AFMVLVGKGNNGKSMVCAALTALLGPENVSHIGLAEFGERFPLYSTLGKLANVVGDLSRPDRADEGRLKSMVTGDVMAFEPKGLGHVSARPTARLTFATNTLPKFADATEGVWRRLLPVRFTTIIPESRRVPGMTEPDWWLASGELP